MYGSLHTETLQVIEWTPGSTGNVGAMYRCIQSVYSQPRPIITRRLQDLGPNDGMRCGFRARNPVDLLRCQCNAAMHIALESQSAKGLGLHLAQAGGRDCDVYWRSGYSADREVGQGMLGPLAESHRPHRLPSILFWQGSVG